MSTPVIPGRTGPEPAIVISRPRRRTWIWGGLAGLVALIALVWLLLIVGMHGMSRPIPSFPSLVANPDSSLQGTVAYTDMQSRCVRTVAAAGGPSRGRSVSRSVEAEPGDGGGSGKGDELSAACLAVGRKSRSDDDAHEANRRKAPAVLR